MGCPAETSARFFQQPTLPGLKLTSASIHPFAAFGHALPALRELVKRTPVLVVQFLKGGIGHKQSIPYTWGKR